MKSMQGNKNSSDIGKPTDDLNTPNEYTLDLLPSPLFSVDILDPQILANNVSAGRYRHESPHMIQIMYLDNSIW